MKRILLAAMCMSPFSFGQIIVFEAVNVLPMDRERVVERQTVVIRDGKITEIGAPGRVKVPDGAVRVDGSDKYLMPGLAEMHGHLPGPGSPPELVAHVLFLYLANGVTTVRGMQGNPEALQHRAAVAAGKLEGPRLYVAGPAFSGGSAKSVDIAQKMVRDQKAAGYDLLKIAEGLTPDAYEAIVKTAREVGIDFAGHVPNDVGVRRAIEVRQRSIDHLDNYLEALEADNSPVRSADAKTRAHQLPFHVDERKISQLAQATRKAGVWNAPTMALWELFHNGDSGDAIRKSMPELQYMPRSIVEQWVKTKNGLLEPGGDVFMGFGVGPKAGVQVIALRRKMLKGLYDAGARIILGTDSPQMFSVPGFSTHREMKVMLESGMRPFDILQSGTRNVAEYFGTVKEAGTVELGKRADLILLNGNPLTDIANVARRAGVVVNGKWYAESEIQSRLRTLAERAAKM